MNPMQRGRHWRHIATAQAEAGRAATQTPAEVVAEAAEALGVAETWRCQRCGARITRLPTLTCGRCGRRVGWCCWGDSGEPGRPQTKRCVHCLREEGAW